jgi:hypothetical protein
MPRLAFVRPMGPGPGPVFTPTRNGKVAMGRLHANTVYRMIKRAARLIAKIKNRDQPIPAIIDVAPNGKQMTADRPEGHAFRPFVILLPSTLGAPA